MSLSIIFLKKNVRLSSGVINLFSFSIDVFILELRISEIFSLISAEHKGTKYTLKKNIIEKKNKLIVKRGLNKISLFEFPVDPNTINSLSILNLFRAKIF